MRLSEPQSHLRYPLTHLLGNGGNVRVLRALAAHGGPLSSSQLARETGLTPQGVRLVVNGLQSQQLVTVWGAARSQLFSLTEDHPFAGPLRTLFELEQSRWERIQQQVRSALKAERHVRSAWLYGSVARGEDAPHSDIDIAMVMDAADPAVAERVRESLLPLQKSQHITFSVTAVTQEDVGRLRPDDRWWSELARDAKVLKGVSPQQERARAKAAAQAA
jgi:predicted nucleotidyltransferase